MSAHVEKRCEESLFTPEEVEVLRKEVLLFLSSKGFVCDDSVMDNQPFLLSVWQALSALTSDQDVELPRLLLEGVSTGIVQPIPPSGVWEKVAEPVAVEQDLRVHLEPWRSASDNLALARKLVMDDVAAGHAFVLPGGEAEARARWGDRIAAGKFGVVQVPGKNPRLIGDGSVSGANAASQVLEKVRNPSLHAVQRFLSCVDSTVSWSLCSFDVKGAHKLVLVREDEQGYSCFVLDCVWYCYRSCYFGCKWAAYWFSRVGAWLVRMLHRVIWVKHGMFLFVDDGLEFLPTAVGPLLALHSLMFLCGIGVPLSWGKLRFGQCLVWIGWKFHADTCQASLPADKVTKALEALRPLLHKGNKVERRQVEKVVGFLGWFCGGLSGCVPGWQPFTSCCTSRVR